MKSVQSACPVKCLPREISVAFISMGPALWNSLVTAARIPLGWLMKSILCSLCEIPWLILIYLRVLSLPRLPNEIFVAFISSGFNFRRNELSGFNRGDLSGEFFN